MTTIFTVTTDGDDMPISTEVYASEADALNAVRDALSAHCKPIQRASLATFDLQQLVAAWEETFDGACIIEQHEIAPQQLPTLAVILEGGMVQDIVSTAPVAVDCWVIDYDVEGADPADVVDVPQGNGTDVPAYVSSFGTPSAASIDLATALRRKAEKIPSVEW